MKKAARSNASSHNETSRKRGWADDTSEDESDDEYIPASSTADLAVDAADPLQIMSSTPHDAFSDSEDDVVDGSDESSDAGDYSSDDLAVPSRQGQTPNKRRQTRKAGVRVEYTPKQGTAATSTRGKSGKEKWRAEPRRKLAPSSLDRLLEGTGGGGGGHDGMHASSVTESTGLAREHAYAPLPSFPSMKAVPNMKKRRFARA